MADPATIEFYNDNAKRYTRTIGLTPHRHLDPFLDRLKTGAHILELGCGGGRDASRMIERGFAVDPTDGSVAMVEKAKERFGLAARQMLFEHLDANEAYEAVWAHACLIHVARTDFPDMLQAIRRALRPNGLHFANFKLGTGEGRDPLGRLHNFPDTAWLDAAYRDAGFAALGTEVYRGEGADGVVRDWYAMTVKRDD